MNIERLNYIYEVSKTGSISIAARNQHVTQSTISQAITSIEKELGVTLFTRSKHGTILTFEGKKLMIQVKELLEKADELRKNAHHFHEELSGVLRIAAIPGFMTIILRVFANFRKEHPKVQLNIAEKNSKEILEAVNYNKLDIGLINFFDNFSQKINNIPFELLYNSHVRICVSKNSSLALKESIKITDLENEAIVLYEDDFILSFTKNLMEKFDLKLLFVTNNVDAIRAAVKEEIAITLVTDNSIIDEMTILNGEIISIPIENIASSYVPFGLVRSNNKKTTLITDKFTDYLKKELHSFEQTFQFN
ncbi:LysR family transcriptional regulator [Gottfriedia sp. NPDC056225]|uniref:LysR family transcriptional regulator n=1 Tax=Gottfriedia sp. NPDC056225 TaxID=3345751 RepID=UPI0035E2D9FA